MTKFTEQQPDDEVLFSAGGAAQQVAKPLLASSRRARTLHGGDVRERLVDVVQAKRRRVRRGDVPRAPDRGAADPDAALTRLAGEKPDRDVDLLWREATKQIGEEADLGEAAAGFRDRSARCDEIVERHA